MIGKVLSFILKCLIITFFIPISVHSQELTSDVLNTINRHKIGLDKVQVTAQLFESQYYVSTKSDTIPYRLLKPLDYDSRKKYPLVVCLSGSGGRGKDNIKQIGGCWPAQILSKPINRKNYPCFVFVPQCPPKTNWVNIKSLVFEIINLLEKEFNIDQKRLYVTGQSMGGFGSWDFILSHPQMFAAAIPMCGGGDTKLAQNIIDLPIWAFHGQKDQAVSVELSRNMIESIKNAGGNPRYTEFPDAYHVIWPLAYDTPGLLDWLFSKRVD